MENKILDFQFGPVCANQTRLNYSVRSEQDEGEIQCDRRGTTRVLTSFVKYFPQTFVYNLAFFPDLFGHRPHLFSLTHTKIGRIFPDLT